MRIADHQIIKLASAFGAAAVLFLSCSRDDKDYTLGAKPAASFTATPLADFPNKVVVNNTTQGTFMYKWDFGNGQTSDKQTDTVLYDTKGEYTIKLDAFGHGGYGEATQTVTITNDYLGTDILKGGNMESDSQADWTVLNTGGTQTNINFTNGELKFSDNADANGAIYQAVTVDKNKTYTFSADVHGDGATNTWFEVYFGTTVPTNGQDYTDNKYVALNTWAGCGGSSFNGNLALIGCDGNGSGKNGYIKFSQSGTVYLVIKAGSCCGGNMGNGIYLDNVMLREK
jgi:hypothetical protein